MQGVEAQGWHFVVFVRLVPLFPFNLLNNALGLTPETLAAQALGEVDPVSRALVPPIHPSTTYERDPDGTYQSGLAYTRADNPTYEHAERLLATLEGGAGGI